MAKKKNNKSKVKPKRLNMPKGKPSKQRQIKSKPQKTKQKTRDYKKTYAYRKLNKKYLRKSDKDYKKKINKFWEDTYNKKGVSAKIARAGVEKKFIRHVRNRFVKTKKKYWGSTGWSKNKKGEWIAPKKKLRQFWRDKLTGEYIKGKGVGLRMKKIMEPDLVKGYMRKHKIKKYQKARSKYLKATSIQQSIRTIIWMYGASP